MSDFRQPSADSAGILRGMDFQHCYRVVQSRDERFDGLFYTGVTSTGIYCRPSCPAITPRRENVRFYPTAAAAQVAGFRACKRCLPGAAPGSPEWNLRGDLVGRAMRMITDGVVEREGIPGLARRLGYSERHLHRTLVSELGAGPLAIAVAQRAHTARVLLETTDLPATELAFAAGFGSIRQFNATMKSVFAASPSDLRQRRAAHRSTQPGPISLRLAYRPPLDTATLFQFLANRAVSGVEEWTGTSFRRSLRLPHGAGWSSSPRPTATFDARSPSRILAILPALSSARGGSWTWTQIRSSWLRRSGWTILGRLARSSRGRRVPGTTDAAELAIRAVIGQQVSVAAARTLAGRLVDRLGECLPRPIGGVTHLFPDPSAIAGADLTDFPMPASRKAAVQTLARALATGSLDLSPGADRQAAERALLDLPGIGAWTASYILMRGLGDPDAFLPTDLGVRRALRRLGHSDRPGHVATMAARWRPWRAYALMHLWASEDSSALEENEPAQADTLRNTP